MSKAQDNLTYSKVESVASKMLAQGITPSNRNVRELTGGRSEHVAKHLNNFNKKRNTELLSIADEIGSSAIGKLIASEIQSVVERRILTLKTINKEQEEQIEEFVEILAEKEEDCNTQISAAERESQQKVADMQAKLDSANDLANRAERTSKQVEKESAKIQEDAKALVTASKSEAQALVAAANKQTEKAEAESTLLREQVKELSIDEAKRDIQMIEYSQTKDELNGLRIEIAEVKTTLIQSESTKEAFEKDVLRLEKELVEAKSDSKQLTQSQAELLQAQKQITTLQNYLAQSERERESLSRALAVNES